MTDLSPTERNIATHTAVAILTAANHINLGHIKKTQVIAAVVDQLDDRAKTLLAALAAEVSNQAYAARVAAMTDAELHATCGHPGFEYMFTQGQRKAWDHSNCPDEPTDSEGWIRNRHVAGGEGWERFDYTEECYWMRPKADR